MIVEEIPYSGFFWGGQIFVDARIFSDSWYKKLVVGSGLNHTPRASVELWPLVEK